MKLARIFYITILCVVFFGKPAQAGIPVIDQTSIVQQVQQVAAWTKQYAQMAQQYKQMYDQFKSLTGGRGISGVLTGLVKQQLPPDFMAAYEQLRVLGMKGSSAGAQDIYKTLKLIPCSALFPTNGPDRILCEASAISAPSNVDFINKSIKSAQERATELQKFISTVDDVSDMKASSDLGNRIQSEMALIQNEQMLMNLALAQRQQEAKLLAQQAAGQGLERMQRRGANPFSLTE